MAKGEFVSDKTVEIKINIEKLRELSHKALTMFHERVYPFNLSDLFPDANIPIGVMRDSRENALFLFYSCSMDSMRRAEEVYESLRKLSEEIDLSKLHELERKDLESLLKRFLSNTRMGDPIDAVYDNSRRLYEFHEGDPRTIYSGFVENKLGTDEDIKETLRKIGEFTQFSPDGTGKSALLMKNFTRFGMWNFPKSRIPIKVDRHINRICLGNQVVEFYRDERKVADKEVTGVRAEKLVRLLTDSFLELTKRDGISAVDLDDSFWAIGSKLCYENLIPFCRSYCRIGCINRPESDPTSTIYYPGTDKRQSQPGKPIEASEGQKDFQWD